MLGGARPESVEFATDLRERAVSPGLDLERESRLLAITDRLLKEGIDADLEGRKRRALNRAHYQGFVRPGWNPLARRVESTIKRAEDGSVDPVEQVSFNVIGPAVDIFTAMFAGAAPITEVEANSSEGYVIEQARACNAFISTEFDRLDMQRLYSDSAKACAIEGMCYWEPWFDHSAGDIIGQEIVGDGDDAVVRDIHAGQMKVSLHLADNVLRDPTATCIDDAQWVLKLSESSPAKVRQALGKEVTPDGLSSETRPVDKQVTKGGVQIRTLMLRPGTYPASDDGKQWESFATGYIIISTKTRVLYEGPRPHSKYPFPLIPIRCLTMPGEYEGRTPVDLLRVAQAGLDMTFTQWVAANRNVAMPRWLKPVECDIPDGAFNDVPGSIIPYTAMTAAGNVKPELIHGAALDYSVQAMVEFLIERYVPHVMGQHQGGAAGGIAPGTESGVHYAQIGQTDFARQNPMARELTCAVERWGDITLELAAENIPEDRMVSAIGPVMGRQMVLFSGSKVRRDFRVRVKPETSVPQTKEQRLQRAAFMLQAQLIDHKTAQERVGAEPGEDPTLAELHTTLARDENFELVTLGQITFPQQLLPERDRGYHAIHLEQIDKLLADKSIDPRREPQKYMQAIAHKKYHEQGVITDQLIMANMQALMTGAPPGEGTPAGPPPVQ